MSDHDSFPGLSGHAADLLTEQGHHDLGDRVRDASVYLTGTHDEGGDTVILEWADTLGPASPDQLETVRSALNSAAQQRADWRFGRLHQRSQAQLN